MQAFSWISIHILMLLGSFSVVAQNYHPATWLTTSGELDAGVVRFEQQILEDSTDFSYGHLAGRKGLKYKFQPASTADLEWLVLNKDTVLRRRSLSEGSELVQLLQAGRVSLYTTIEDNDNFDYLWYNSDGNWYVPKPDNIKEVGYTILQQNCPSFRKKYHKRLWTDVYLGRMTKAINKCLYKRAPREPNYLAFRRHQLGIAWQALRSDSPAGILRVLPSTIIGLRYQYKPSKKWQYLSIVLQLNAQNYHRDEEISVRGSGSFSRPLIYREQIELRMGSFQLGTVWEPFARRHITPFLEFGGMINMFSNFQRELNLLSSPTGFDGNPIWQETTYQIPMQFDTYYALGARWVFKSRWHLSFRWQKQHIIQSWPTELNGLWTSNFRAFRTKRLLDNVQTLLQLSISYGW